MLTYVMFSILLCIIIYYITLLYRNMYPLLRIGRILPGPKALPIVGNGLYFLKWNYDEFLDSVNLLVDTYPSPFRVWMMSKLFVCVHEPDHIKTILRCSNCLNKSIMYKSMKPYAKTGLIISNVPTWNMHRKIISPSINTNVLRQFHEEFMTFSLILMNELQKIENVEFNLLHNFHNFTISSIYGTMFGISGTMLKYMINKNNQVIESCKRFGETVYYRTRNILLFFDAVFNLTHLGRIQRKDIDFSNSILEEVMENREKERHNLESKNKHANSNKKGPKIFMDILFDALGIGKFTPADVQYECNTMMVAVSISVSVAVCIATFVTNILLGLLSVFELHYQNASECT